MQNYIKHFGEIKISDIPSVGGKNASLGEMYRNLASKGIKVPDGFAVMSNAFWDFLDENKIRENITSELKKLDRKKYDNLASVGENIRQYILQSGLSNDLKGQITNAYEQLKRKYGETISVAVRSSATAEDLPNASFAGQQETFLHIDGEETLLNACLKCYASLYTNRAIKYREDNGFEHMKVALSIGVQVMVRSDLASSGVIFTLEPDSGFRDIVLVSGSWGLGENVVKGYVNPDEFYVFKPSLMKEKNAIVRRKLGSKLKTLVYSGKATPLVDEAIVNLDTSEEKQQKYVLNDKEIEKLAKWAIQIEAYYGQPMDIEWAKDGLNNELFIVQARPETVFSRKSSYKFVDYTLKSKGELLCKGIGLGNKIVAGKARLIRTPADANKLGDGEILITEKTDPDWDPIMKKASAVITDQGGRTSHAAIVARELGLAAIVGSGNATQMITDGQEITVSCAEGETGNVYKGILQWEEKEIDTENITMPKTQTMLILGDPEMAFKLSFLPNNGIGLMRMEFIINNSVRVHPMALKQFAELKDTKAIEEIEKLTRNYANKEDYFVQQLAENTALIAAAFYPKDVIVRMSDFKSNEYANLIGGRQFEPEEENPMIGFRGASRYYHPLYRGAFEMECKAMKMVRDDMGLNNVKIMIPFCRSLSEAEKVLEIMDQNGLKRGKDGLELYMMVEIPSNVILAEEFAEYFDGFSIGSNDLTQLTLGADRDSELLKEIFDPFDSAVKKMVAMAIEKAKKTGTKIGLCGQAPSDYPEYARFLVECGIDSISFNADALMKGLENIVQAEREKVRGKLGG